MRVNNKLILKWRGQTFVEVVVALAVVTTLAVSLITASLITQKAARTARNNTQATKLVQQNIEQMRIFRDRKGSGALTNGTCFTLNLVNSNDPNTWLLDPTTYCPAAGTQGELITFNNTVFYRVIAISTPDPINKPKEKLVVVTVNWTDSQGTQTVSDKTFFTDWEGYK